MPSSTTFTERLEESIAATQCQSILNQLKEMATRATGKAWSKSKHTRLDLWTNVARLAEAQANSISNDLQSPAKPRKPRGKAAVLPAAPAANTPPSEATQAA